MTLIFVQLVAIFSVVKISTALTGDNGWSTDIPTETFTKMYFFNCTNPEDVMANGAKPLLKQVEYISAVLKNFFAKFCFQVGPYTFLEQRSKTNITYNPDYTVEYRSLSSFWVSPFICRDHTCVPVY